MKAIDELAGVVAPPSAPHAVSWDDPAWNRLFNFIGTRLPTDFVMFHKVFGIGYFFSHTHRMSANLSVSGGIRSLSLLAAFSQGLTALRLAKERSGSAVPYPLYWEPHGLLPWGETTNDVFLCWEVRGELVDNWNVVAVRPASRQSERYDMGMAEFLTAIFSNRIACPMMPNGLPGKRGVGFERAKYLPDIDRS